MGGGKQYLRLTTRKLGLREVKALDQGLTAHAWHSPFSGLSCLSPEISKAWRGGPWRGSHEQEGFLGADLRVGSLPQLRAPVRTTRMALVCVSQRRRQHVHELGEHLGAGVRGTWGSALALI